MLDRGVGQTRAWEEALEEVWGGEARAGMGTREDEGGSSESESSSEGGGRPLEQETWFHGHLAREDLEKLLKAEGDFAVRYSLEQKPQLVLSVMGKGGKLLSFIVHQSRSGTFFVQKKEFESVGDLVVFHQMTRTAVAEGSGALLRKAAGPLPWELGPDELDMRSRLGEGEFGLVSRALWKTKGRETLVAVKELKTDKDWRLKQELLAEARLQLALSHPHIVRCLGLAVKKEPLRMVLELVEGGSLLEWLRKGPALPSPFLQGLLKELLGALVYLDQKGVVHRDVAARNCLLAFPSPPQGLTGATLKLSDFGLALQKPAGGAGFLSQLGLSLAKTGPKDWRRVPLRWTAPEALAKEDFSHKSDVWSFGVVVWEAFSGGKEPWTGKKTEEVRRELAAQRGLPSPCANPSAALSTLLASALTHDPAQRPSASRLLSAFPSTL